MTVTWLTDALLAEAEDELERARLEVSRLEEQLVFAQAAWMEKRRLRERLLCMKEEAQEELRKGEP